MLQKFDCGALTTDAHCFSAVFIDMQYNMLRLCDLKSPRIYGYLRRSEQHIHS